MVVLELVEDAGAAGALVVSTGATTDVVDVVTETVVSGAETVAVGVATTAAVGGTITADEAFVEVVSDGAVVDDAAAVELELVEVVTDVDVGAGVDAAAVEVEFDETLCVIAVCDEAGVTTPGSNPFRYAVTIQSKSASEFPEPKLCTVK